MIKGENYVQNSTKRGAAGATCLIVVVFGKFPIAQCEIGSCTIHWKIPAQDWFHTDRQQILRGPNSWSSSFSSSSHPTFSFSWSRAPVALCRLSDPFHRCCEALKPRERTYTFPRTRSSQVLLTKTCTALSCSWEPGKNDVNCDDHTSIDLWCLTLAHQPI